MGSDIFGTLIRARKARGASQAFVADWMGVSREHFSRIENGHKEASFLQLCHWAEALGVEICARTVTNEARR